jgi:hypothetical protein
VRQIQIDFAFLAECTESLQHPECAGIERSALECFHGSGLLSRIKPARDFDLCEQVLCAIDGTSNQMGEVGDESKERNEVGTQFHLAAIDVNRLIEALKGVEADADRENHVERER